MSQHNRRWIKTCTQLQLVIPGQQWPQYGHWPLHPTRCRAKRGEETEISYTRHQRRRKLLLSFHWNLGNIHLLSVSDTFERRISGKNMKLARKLFCNVHEISNKQQIVPFLKTSTFPPNRPRLFTPFWLLKSLCCCCGCDTLWEKKRLYVNVSSVIPNIFSIASSQPPPTLYCSPSKQPPTHQHSYWDLLILQVAVQTSGSPANSDRQCDLDMFWGSDFPMAAKLFAASSRTLESESDLLAINNGWHILQTPATIHILQLCYSSSILVGFSPIHHSPLTLLQSMQTKKYKSIKQLLKMRIKKLKMEILARFGKEPLGGASMLAPMNLDPAKIPAYQ